MSHLCKYCYGRGVRTTKRSLFENKYVRTDLACESGRVAPADCKGAVYERKEDESITVERLNVLNESGEEETGKEIGCYVTVSGAAVRLDLGQDTVLSSIIEKEIRRLCEKTVGITITKSTRVLVAGVGNAMISSDSLGPMTAEMISPTRHLMSVDEFKFLECSEVSVIKTAVLGQTGIESSELIKSICEKKELSMRWLTTSKALLAVLKGLELQNPYLFFIVCSRMWKAGWHMSPWLWPSILYRLVALCPQSFIMRHI